MSGLTFQITFRPAPPASARCSVVSALVALALLTGASRAQAQEGLSGVRLTPASFGLAEPSPFLPSDGILASATPALPLDQPAPVFGPASAPPPRLALRTLEVSFAALQALDVVSTLKAVDQGLVERNPLMRGLVSRPAAFVAVKAGATVTTLWLVRRVARQNRVAAFITLAAIDSGYALLVSRNLQALRR